MKAFFSFAAFSGGLLCLFPVSAFAQLDDDTTTPIPLRNITLAGNQKYDTWDALASIDIPGTGGFPGTGTWTYQNQGGKQYYLSQFPSGVSDDERAGLKKNSNGSDTKYPGGPYAGYQGIYFGGSAPATEPNVNGGELSIVDYSPLAGVQTIALQIEIGQATGYDFWNNVLPELFLTHADGTTEAITADHSGVIAQQENGEFSTPEGVEPLFVKLYGLQWNVSTFTGITAIDIRFTAVQHASLYGMRLDQSSEVYLDPIFTYIPEPSTYALLLGAGALGMMLLRRRRAK